MKKNIGFLIMNFNNGGGTEHVTAIIANELAKRNYNITIFSCQQGKNNKFDINDNINICSLSGERFLNPLLRKLNVYYCLKKEIKRRNINTIIAVDIALYLYLIPIQIRYKIKCIAWEHFNCTIRLSRLTEISRYLASKLANCIVVLTKGDLDNYKIRFKNIKRIEYIYNPIFFDFEKVSTSNEKRVIAVGRLSREKGFDMLIDAWKIVEQNDNEWKLDIFGTGKLENTLKKQIEFNNLKRCKLCGYSNNIEEEYRKSSLFVLPSRFEGFGLVVLEALSKGIPVVCFKCPGGISEIIQDNVNGIFVEQGNINELAKKILLLIHNNDLRNSLANNSSYGLEKFELSLIINQWIKLLDNL